jgi:hypothetical protein
VNKSRSPAKLSKKKDSISSMSSGKKAAKNHIKKEK